MTIRTPDDEVDKPGWFTPPFAEGRNYQGITYPGHSNFSVDFNRRTPAGGWLDDTGDPVLAVADGIVSEVDKAEGLVMVKHAGGYTTEYRHMTGIRVAEGDRVQRSDRLGDIGNVAGSGASFGAHLHHVHHKGGKRIKMTFEGKPIATSVFNSDTQPEGWKPPSPVNVVGPPPRATWESAYKEAAKALEKSDEAREGWRGKAALLKEEMALAVAAAGDMRNALTVANARITELENRPGPDCAAQLAAQRASLLAAVRNGVGALVDGLEAEG